MPVEVKMIIQAKLKGVFTLDMDHLEVFSPSDREVFALTVRAMVGPKSEAGEESFDLQVCTPSWLDVECRRLGFVKGRYLIVSAYDPAVIISAVRSLVERIDGSSWEEVARKLARWMDWEFDDY